MSDTIETYCLQVQLYIFSDIMDTLRKSGKVNGIILPVLNETERPDYLSPDQSCPNVGSGKSNINIDLL